MQSGLLVRTNASSGHIPCTLRMLCVQHLHGRVIPSEGGRAAVVEEPCILPVASKIFVGDCVTRYIHGAADEIQGFLGFARNDTFLSQNTGGRSIRSCRLQL